MEEIRVSTATTARERLEIWFGLTLALCAAMLAINDLGAGRYGDDELQLSNEKTSAYLWYQAKGIKETLTLGQRDLLQSLLAAGAVTGDRSAAIEAEVASLSQDVDRYKKEKREILLGSRAVDPRDHSQEVDGKLGRVVGAKQIEEQLAGLGAAGDCFDLANLFFQISLVFGAIGLMMQRPPLKRLLLGGVIGLGAVGLGFSTAGFKQAHTADAAAAAAAPG